MLSISDSIQAEWSTTEWPADRPAVSRLRHALLHGESLTTVQATERFGTHATALIGATNDLRAAGYQIAQTAGADGLTVYRITDPTTAPQPFTRTAPQPNGSRQRGRKPAAPKPATTRKVQHRVTVTIELASGEQAVGLLTALQPLAGVPGILAMSIELQAL